MKTFIINMEKDKKNLDRTIAELNKLNFDMNNVFKYNAINGKELNRWNEDVNFFCKLYCTDKMIGCGLSHIKLCQSLKNEESEYILIIEDDIKAIPNMNVHTEIDKVHSEINLKDPNWDIIVLHKQGICKDMEKTAGRICGSTAAYLISKSGINKISKLKLSHHIDLNRNSNIFNTYSGRHLFDTYEKESKIGFINNITFLNKPFYFWTNQPAAHIPLINFDISIVFFMTLLVILYSLVVYNTIYKKTLKSPIVLFNTLVTFFATFLIYSNNDISYYRCSKATHYFGLTFPIFIIMLLFMYHKENVLIFSSMYSLSLSMLFFHIFYHFEINDN